MKETTPLGAYIQHQVRERKTNVRAFALSAGLRQGTLQRITSGAVKEPRISIMQAIANALGVPLTDLIAIQQGKQPGGEA